MTRPSTALLLLSLALLGSSACRSDDDVCHEAAELCGASTDFDEGSCSGQQRAYAACIVDQGECSAEIAVECASEGGGEGGALGITLELEKWDVSGSYLDIDFVVRNVSEPSSVPTLSSLFYVEDLSGGLHSPSGGFCQGEAVAPGGMVSCALQWNFSGEPASLRYEDDQGRSVSVDLDAGACQLRAENTAMACSDGCSNDGDQYVDCDDYDCCPSRPDCPATSSCGQRQ